MCKHWKGGYDHEDLGCSCYEGFYNFFALFDETGYKWRGKGIKYTGSTRCSHNDWNPKSQKGLFNDATWTSLSFEPLSEKEISETEGELSIKWAGTTFPDSWSRWVYTLEEWNEYLKSLE